MIPTHIEAINQVQAFVKNDQLKKALVYLESYYQNDPEPLQNVIVLTSQLTVLKKQQGIGNIDITSFNLSYNDLKVKVLTLVNAYGVVAAEPVAEPMELFLHEDQPFKRSIVRSVIMRLLHDYPDGLGITEIVRLARFKRSGRKDPIRKLVKQSLDEMMAAVMVTKKKKNKLTCYGLTAKGLQILEGFKETTLFKEKEG